MVLSDASWNPEKIESDDEIYDAHIRKVFALSLRELRRQRGISQDDMALDSNVSRRQTSRIENEHSDAELPTVVRFCDGLGITFERMGAEFDRQRKKAK